MAVLTEDEAKKRWCPYTRVALSEGMAANRSGAKDCGLDPSGVGYANIYEETRCLGSGCMMWEWEKQLHRSPAPRGFCGLTTMMGLES